MAVPLRFQCLTCRKRTYWCRYCTVRHCGQCSPHVSKRRQYLAKNHIIKKRNGQTIIMSARRYAHLTGASKGGSVTASRPNPGRFTTETARTAAQTAWATRWRHSAYDPTLRIGRPRKNRPAVDRAAVRAKYAQDRNYDGLTYWPPAGNRTQGLWSLDTTVYPNGDGNMAITSTRVISERAALRRLGLIPTGNKNWVPGQDEKIVKTTVGRLPALKRDRKRRTE